jgi:hypothetical protein
MSKSRKYFDMHQRYVRSLRPIKVSPAIAHLDVIRRECFPDGTLLERSPRDWAKSLTLVGGVTPARCDVTNGSSDFQTYLLVPSPHLAEIQVAVRDYRFRLNILGERETRFCDSLPVAPPSEIILDFSSQENLSFIESLSTDDFWSKVPDSVRKSGSTASQSPPPKSPKSQGSGPRKRSVDDDPSGVHRLSKSSPSPDGPGGPETEARRVSRNPQSDDLSLRLAVSASLAATVLSRLDEMDKDLKAQKLEFTKFVAQTNQSFDKDENRLDGVILQSMAKHQAASMTAFQTQFEGMMAQLMASLHPTIATSPSARRPHSSTYESYPIASATTPPSSDDLVRVSLSSNALVCHDASRSSMSIASGSSDSSLSHVKPPQSKKTKKSRSISNDMEQLSTGFEAGSDSEFSDMDDIDSLVPLTSVTPSLSIQCDSVPIPTIDALTDPNIKYNYLRDSDGGASE